MLSKYVPSMERTLFIMKPVHGLEFSLGIIVTKKVGCAVIRNYVKRKIRNAFYNACSNIKHAPSIAFVIIGKKECIKADFANLVNIIKTSIGKFVN